jgi:hypothetical protein
MFNNFVTNLVIQNIKNKKVFGGPARQSANKRTGLSFEPEHLSWSSLPRF